MVTPRGILPAGSDYFSSISEAEVFPRKVLLIF